jgi:hypothetical protein
MDYGSNYFCSAEMLIQPDNSCTYEAAYPVLHASLSILTESAVMTKASAHARCPMCGLDSESKITQVSTTCINAL